ncbi:hypothetical protein ACRAWD_29760 [Caulobacter segnis]
MLIISREVEKSPGVGSMIALMRLYTIGSAAAGMALVLTLVPSPGGGSPGAPGTYAPPAAHAAVSTR